MVLLGHEYLTWRRESGDESTMRERDRRETDADAPPVTKLPPVVCLSHKVIGSSECLGDGRLKPGLLRFTEAMLERSQRTRCDTIGVSGWIDRLCHGKQLATVPVAELKQKILVGRDVDRRSGRSAQTTGRGRPDSQRGVHCSHTPLVGGYGQASAHCAPSLITQWIALPQSRSWRAVRRMRDAQFVG